MVIQGLRMKYAKNQRNFCYDHSPNPTKANTSKPPFHPYLINLNTHPRSPLPKTLLKHFQIQPSNFPPVNPQLIPTVSNLVPKLFSFQFFGSPKSFLFFFGAELFLEPFFNAGQAVAHCGGGRCGWVGCWSSGGGC